ISWTIHNAVARKTQSRQKRPKACLQELSRRKSLGAGALSVELQHAFGDVLGAEPEMLHQFPRFAGNAKAVRDPDPIEQKRQLKLLPVLENRSRHKVAEASHLVFLRGHDQPGLF